MIKLSRILHVRAQHVPWLVISVVLLIIAATIVVVTLNLRRGLRNQIIQQDGIMLYAASMVPTTVAEELPEDLAKDPEFKFLDLTEKVLKASDQKGVLAAQIYGSDGKVDPNGKLDPKGIAEGNDDQLGNEELEKLRRF